LAGAFGVGARRWLKRFAPPAGGGERLAQVGSRALVNGHEHGHVLAVIADAPLGHGLAERLLQEDAIGYHLEPVGGPGGGDVAGQAPGPAALVLVGEVGAVLPAGAEDPARQAEGAAARAHRAGPAPAVGR